MRGRILEKKKFMSTLKLSFDASNTVMNPEKGLTLDEAFVRAGGFGKFQFILLIFYCFTITCASYVTYNIDFLCMRPVYEAFDEETQEWIESDADTICPTLETDNPLKYRVNWDSVDSLDNWVPKLDLMCTPDEKLYWMYKIYYIGEMLGGLIITRIPDVFGRKWALAILTTLQFPIYLAIVLS
jgi:hypothetical protein